MNDKKQINVRVGGGVFIPITIALAILKLFGLIHISWWMVTVLIWGSLLFMLALVIIAFIVGMLIAAFGK